MKRVIFLLLSILCLTGCYTVQPLSLRYYRRNLVLDKDCCLRVEKFETTGVKLEEIDIANLRKELTKRVIINSTPITIHVHRYAAGVAFEEVYNKLKAEGYWNLEFVDFRDPEPVNKKPPEKK